MTSVARSATEPHESRPDIIDKGLAHDSVGLLGRVVLALSSVAHPRTR